MTPGPPVLQAYLEQGHRTRRDPRGHLLAGRSHRLHASAGAPAYVCTQNAQSPRGEATSRAPRPVIVLEAQTDFEPRNLNGFELLGGTVTNEISCTDGRPGQSTKRLRLTSKQRDVLDQP